MVRNTLCLGVCLGVCTNDHLLHRGDLLMLKPHVQIERQLCFLSPRSGKIVLHESI